MTTPHLDRAALAPMGETPAAVHTRLRSELDAFEAHLRGRETDWTRVQPGRDWTPAQEAEHVALINESITRVLALLLSDREVRPAPQTPGELSPEGRRVAPPHTRPSETGLAWAEWPARWAQGRAALEAATADLRPTPGRTLWHPFFGELDALDWARMVAAHLAGHRRALERSAGA
ncbi:DinB family protein [Deinococcus multiflagellatus]|uniref:DinB family protein n=1 Tax=Deinococcus multiflagellatus TaxID=1656887 RepID=UPI001CCEC26B|nr:DinB family protein [Deinococcus multiflagellatus]MBZ9715202.1 DinB family protein [Deinococcus multiflagellatus]